MLKILHIESSLGWGGQEHRTLKEMREMRNRGHCVELLTRPEAKLAERAAAENFTTHAVKMRGGADLIAVWQMLKIIKSNDYDVVNTHSGHDSLLGGLAGRLARKPLVVRTRHLALAITSLATYKWLPHKVVTVSEWVEKYLVSVGVPAENVKTIYTGIEAAPKVENPTLRKELNLADDDILSVTVAILRYEKGHKSLIDAAIPLFAKYPKLHLVFAGDGPIFEELKNYIAELNLSERIHLLGLRKDLPNVLQSCDFFTLPTWQEALGTSFIEAMNSGLAVIGSAVDGVPEVIQDGKNGLLIEAKNEKSIQTALERLITDVDLRKQMGKVGKEITQTKFSVAKMAEEMESFYIQSIQERNK